MKAEPLVRETVGVGEGVVLDELNCNQQLATFKGKIEPCPPPALAVAFPGTWELICPPAQFLLTLSMVYRPSSVNCGPKKSNTNYIMAQVFKSMRILQMNVKIFNLMF